MTEVINRFLIGNGNFFPTIHIKIDKGIGKFLYCIVLYIIVDDESIELCHCDNYHDKGNHIHFKKFNGTEEQDEFKFEGIGKTIDYFQENWEKIMEDMK